MAKNWAIVIGINQYNPNNLRPLKYAKHDAENMRDFFREMQFDAVWFFSEDSPTVILPNGAEIPTYPSFGHLISFLEDWFDRPRLSTGDNCWFFFAGHGKQYADRDYLMPIDANPRGSAIERTAIPVNYVRERLSRCGADNVILILDACRDEGARGTGIGSESQPGIITISSCSPTETSWEIDDLQQGVFTYALLEALRMPGEHSCATVERLGNYLRQRVPSLCQRYNKSPVQIPRISADPSEKHHFILMPQYAWDADIATLKADAYRLAFVEGQLDRAEQACIRAIAASSGRDLELLKLYTRIEQLKLTPFASSPSPTPQPTTRTGADYPDSGQARSTTPIPTELPTPDTHEDDLASEQFGTGYYTKLRDLLKAGEWKRADHETTRLMLELAGRNTDRWLRVKDISSFPTQDLCVINQLWMKYSNGKFGFSTQKQIWQSCSSPTTYGENWDKFGDAIGWRKNGEWDRWGYSLNPLAAPRGHFPRDFAFHSTEGGSAHGKQASPVSLTSKLLGRNFQTLSSQSNEDIQESEDDLSSERFGADYYAKLRDLLKAGHWKEADQETADRMCEVMDRQKEGWLRQKEGWLRVEDIKNFPRQDLQNINRLWVKYSNGKFGFSVQKNIWQECGSPKDYNDDWKKFCDRVGWRVAGLLIYYEDVIFDTSAPRGHLPAVFWKRRSSLMKSIDEEFEMFVDGAGVEVLFFVYLLWDFS